MHKLLRHRAIKPLAVLITSLAALIATCGTANAQIAWPGVQMVNQASQQCLKAGPLDSHATTEAGCMAAATDFLNLTSVWSDGWDSTHGTFAQVAIVWDSASSKQECLTSGFRSSGPNGPNSAQTYWANCDASSKYQEWDMWTAAPMQNVGNPAGLKHFIGFYNVGSQTCLDGGWNVYGFAESDCSKSNNWQIWNIYTNMGSY